MRLQVHQTASGNPLFSHPFCYRLDDVGNIVIVPLSLSLSVSLVYSYACNLRDCSHSSVITSQVMSIVSSLLITI